MQKKSRGRRWTNSAHEIVPPLYEIHAHPHPSRHRYGRLYAAKEEAAKAIPKEAFGVYSFEDAQKQSAKKKDPIVFLLVNERAEDAKVEAAGKITYWGLEKDNTVVVLRPNSAGEWSRRLPAALPAAINAKDLGKEYPRVVVMDHTGSVVLTSVPAAKLIDGGEDAVKALNKEIKELAKNPPSPRLPPPPLLQEPHRPLQLPPLRRLQLAQWPFKGPVWKGGPAPMDAPFRRLCWRSLRIKWCSSSPTATRWMCP